MESKDVEKPQTKNVVLDYDVYSAIHRIGSESFSDAIGRMQEFHKRKSAIRQLVRDLLRMLLNASRGNVSKEAMLNKKRTEIFKLFEGV